MTTVSPPLSSAVPSTAAGHVGAEPVVAGPRMRRTALWLGSIFTVVTLAVGLFGLLANIAFDRNIHTMTLSAGDLTGVATVSIDNSAGDVRVEGSSSTEAVIEADVSDGLFRARHHQGIDGDALRLSASCPVGFATRCHVDHDLVVPSTMALAIKGRMGAVDIVAVDGPLDVDSSFGPLTIVGGTGTMTIDHGFGSIDGRSLASPSVEVSNHFGDTNLAFRSVPEQIEVTSRFGPVVIELPDDGTAYLVTGTTEVGTRSIEVRFDPTSEHRIHIDSTFGDVTVRYAR